MGIGKLFNCVNKYENSKNYSVCVICFLVLILNKIFFVLFISLWYIFMCNKVF